MKQRNLLRTSIVLGLLRKDEAGNEVVAYGFLRTGNRWKLIFLDNINEQNPGCELKEIANELPAEDRQ